MEFCHQLKDRGFPNIGLFRMSDLNQVLIFNFKIINITYNDMSSWAIVERRRRTRTRGWIMCYKMGSVYNHYLYMYILEFCI
jgi:hypothetical protein